MDFERFIGSLNPEPVVQEKKKYANFTVRMIGGPEEIKKWREIQAAKESAYRVRLNDRDTRITSFEAETGQKLAEPTIHTTSWQEKVAFAKEERKRLAKKEKAVSTYNWQPTPEPKITIGQRIVGFFKDVWKSANL